MTHGVTRTDEDYYREKAADADRLLNSLSITERQAGLGPAIEAERDLWAQLADETRIYLDRRDRVTYADTEPSTTTELLF